MCRHANSTDTYQQLETFSGMCYRLLPFRWLFSVTLNVILHVRTKLCRKKKHASSVCQIMYTGQQETSE
jgi:hypothetical protein